MSIQPNLAVFLNPFSIAFLSILPEIPNFQLKYCFLVNLSIFITFFLLNQLPPFGEGGGGGATSKYVQISLVHFINDVISHE